MVQRIETKDITESDMALILRLEQLPEWNIYKQFLLNHIAVRRRLCTAIIVNQEDMAKHNHLAGEADGIMFAIESINIIKQKREQDELMKQSNISSKNVNK